MVLLVWVFRFVGWSHLGLSLFLVNGPIWSSFFPQFHPDPASFLSTRVLLSSRDALPLYGYIFPIGFCVAREIDFFLDRQGIVRKVSFAMASQNEPIHRLMTKKPTVEASIKQATAPERRGKRRCKITQLMRIRPSDPKKPHFEDLRGSMSVSRSGVYFQSSEPGYEVGLRLFVTMPYSNDPASLNREYLAEVVRRDVLPTGMFGIGIKILMEMGIQHTYNFGGSTPF